MILLAAREIARQFDVAPVFQGVSFEIRPGEKVGLVGPNGSGKTTLMSVLAGVDDPDRGAVERHPSCRIALLEQETSFPPGRTLLDEVRSGLAHLYQLQETAHDLADRMAAARGDELARLQKQYDALHHELDRLDAYHIDHRVDEVLLGLGFAPEDYHRSLTTFSGGQQNRALLGRLLLAAPDLMLLDEPTNHLDIATTEWLEQFLARSPQAVLVVSHDRYFLDRVTSRTLEIWQGGVNDYEGNFSHFWKQRDERMKVLRRTYEKQQEFIERTEDFIRRNFAGQKSAQAKDREKKLERLERIEIPPEIVELPMGFPEPTRTGDWVLQAAGVEKGFPAAGPDGRPAGPPRALFTDVTLQVDRGDRVAVLGPNGSGKTTLIRTLIGEIPLDRGQVRKGTGVKFGYFDQQLDSVDAAETAVEAVRPADNPHVTPGELRSLLARFGIKGELALQAVGNMSGGEKTKTALARLAALKANVLILDEPTNHLDFWACAALERSLRDFDGTVLFVSHDRYFVDQVATKIIALEPDRWRFYEGNYSAYQHFLEHTVGGTDNPAAPSGSQAAVSPARTGGDPPRRRRKFPYRKVEEIEADIADHEARIARYQADLADPATHRDGARIRDIKRGYEESETLLAQLLEHWEEALELN